eukprot:gene22711-28863_t
MVGQSAASKLNAKPLETNGLMNFSFSPKTHGYGGYSPPCLSSKQLTVKEAMDELNEVERHYTCSLHALTVPDYTVDMDTDLAMFASLPRRTPPISQTTKRMSAGPLPQSVIVTKAKMFAYLADQLKASPFDTMKKIGNYKISIQELLPALESVLGRTLEELSGRFGQKTAIVFGASGGRSQKLVIDYIPSESLSDSSAPHGPVIEHSMTLVDCAGVEDSKGPTDEVCNAMAMSLVKGLCLPSCILVVTSMQHLTMARGAQFLKILDRLNRVYPAAENSFQSAILRNEHDLLRLKEENNVALTSIVDKEKEFDLQATDCRDTIAKEENELCALQVQRDALLTNNTPLALPPLSPEKPIVPRFGFALFSSMASSYSFVYKLVDTNNKNPVPYLSVVANAHAKGGVFTPSQDNSPDSEHQLCIGRDLRNDEY